jgi:uncharacterized protein (TIGR03066 family)
VKTRCAVVMLVFVALCVSGCSSGSANPLVGKWETEQGGMKMGAEFGSDGKATITMMGQKLEGTYKVTGDELEWTVKDMPPTKCKFKVSGNELQITKEGNTMTYKKV